MYPRNNASPERIAIGQVILIADGTIQTSGVAITVRGQGGAEATGAGTTDYGADGTVYYTPTQTETNYTSFVVIASKTSCFSASQTVVTTASSTAGNVVLSAETHTGAVVPSVTLTDTCTTNTDMRGTDGANTTSPPTAAAIVNEWESQSQADPTGFHVNVLEVNGLPEDIATETKQDIIDANVDSILTNIAALNNISTTEVATEINNALNSDVIAELSGVPAASSTLADKINWLFMLARNTGTQTTTAKTLLADDGVTAVATSTVSSDGITLTRGEFT